MPLHQNNFGVSIMQGAYSARYDLTKFLLPAAILICLIIGYWTSYQKLSLCWAGGDNNCCYLVIPLFAYLLWDKRSKSSAEGGRTRAEMRGARRRLIRQDYGAASMSESRRRAREEGGWTKREERG
jgi:hypothetical protein